MVSFTLVKTYENNKINGNILTNLDSVHFNKDPTFNLATEQCVDQHFKPTRSQGHAVFVSDASGTYAVATENILILLSNSVV